VLDVRLPLLPGSVTDGPVTVLVRPEMVELMADPAGSARVIAASFLGSIARVQVRLADGTLVLAQVSSADVGRFEPGDAVRVGLKPTPALAIEA
jgi:putative spermidine/putrescine transport system ATP-binding protein